MKIFYYNDEHRSVALSLVNLGNQIQIEPNSGQHINLEIPPGAELMVKKWPDRVLLTYIDKEEPIGGPKTLDDAMRDLRLLMDSDRAYLEWWTKPNPELGGVIPMTMIKVGKTQKLVQHIYNLINGEHE